MPRPALLLTLLLTAAAQAQEIPERYRFGALYIGMPLEAARAAAPETEWTETDKHAETGRVYSIRGARAVTLADVAFDVTIGARAIGAHHWQLESNETAANAMQCEARTLAIIAALESRFGAFHQPQELLRGESRIRAGNSSDVVVSAAERLEPVSRNEALRRDPEQYWVRSRHESSDASDAEVSVRADYARDRARTCAIEVEIRGGAPAAEARVLTKTEIVAQPTISHRNRTLREIGAPPETLQFAIRCSMHAGTGEIRMCLSADPAAGPYEVLATRWALDYRFKAESAQIADESLVAVTVLVQMGPADLRSANIASGRRFDPAQIVVRRRRGAQPNVNYKLDGPLEISVLCEVMEDGSLICDVPAGTTAPPVLAAAAVKIAENMEVEPLLRDGTPAAGGLIERKITMGPPRR